MLISSLTTHFADVTSASGNKTVESGNAIRIYGLTVSESGGANPVVVTFKTSQSSPSRPTGTVYKKIAVLAGDTVVDEIAFVADLGLVVSITGNGTAQITVHHDHPGR